MAEPEQVLTQYTLTRKERRPGDSSVGNLSPVIGIFACWIPLNYLKTKGQRSKSISLESALASAIAALDTYHVTVFGIQIVISLL